MVRATNVYCKGCERRYAVQPEICACGCEMSFYLEKSDMVNKSEMAPMVFAALVDELSNVDRLNDLPEWIPCNDCDILRSLPRMGQRRRWLRKAKAEITRLKIQERVDEIAEAHESEDEVLIEVLLGAFPKDLECHKNLTPVQRRMWIDKASLAACGRYNEVARGESVVYFIACGDDLIKIGYTTNLRSRLRSLRTATPKELRVLLVIPGMRDDEQKLHRKFQTHRAGREWFSMCSPIIDFISTCRWQDLNVPGRTINDGSSE